MSQTHKKIVVGFIVISILGLLWVFGRPRRAEAITNKREYPVGTDLDISIQNNLGTNICFSSCCPYFLQLAANGDWSYYEYGMCTSPDTVSTCIPDKGFKQFRLPLEGVEAGSNRMMIPICMECRVGQEFRQDQGERTTSCEKRAVFRSCCTDRE